MTPALIPLFFVSGACGLIYQVLWLRLLGLVFGVTVYAASTVWASFMAGLAIGSYVGGRLGDRVRRPLVWFGAIELSIGLTALTTPALLDQLQRLYVALQPSLPHSLPAVTTARAAIAFAVLIVPTVLMGATLPLVLRSALGQSDQIGTKAGLLYGTNTAGAIAGTLAAGLLFIPGLGIWRTFLIAAILNMTTGLIAVTLGLRTLPRNFRTASSEPSLAPIAADPPTTVAPSLRRLVLIVFFISGFASLALEVIWFRIIVLIVRPTVYGFAVMLATILLGIAIGSYLVTPLMRRRIDWLGTLAGIEVASGLTALLSLTTLNWVPVVHDAILPAVSVVLPDYLAYPIAASVPALLPTSVLLGVAFPIGLRLWAGAGSELVPRVASRTGVFYSLNVVGAILGSLVTGFLLLPALGSRNSLVLASGLLCVSGLALLLAGGIRTTRRLGLAIASVVLFAAIAFVLEDPFDAFLTVRYPRDQVLWREESVQSTVSVHRDPRGGLGLYLEGNHQASDQASMVFVHRRIGHLALVVHPDPREALVVGLGGGATAGAAAIHSGVALTVVELSPSVVRAASFFEHVNHGLLKNPRVRVVTDDGRNHLLLTSQRYDVIAADIILPFHAGANNLYSADYFRLAREALRPGGLVLQWVSGTEAEYKTIMRTFLSVFPETTLWGDGSLMIGSDRPLRLRQSDFDWKLQVPGRREAFAELGIKTFDDLLKQYIAGPAELSRLVGAGPVLTDDRPLTEYFLSLPRTKEVNLTGVQGDVREILADPRESQ
ncbi:MAG: fused MFS/spermidine synthase [Vicinamibacterales bacterium]